MIHCARTAVDRAEAIFNTHAKVPLLLFYFFCHLDLPRLDGNGNGNLGDGGGNGRQYQRRRGRGGVPASRRSGAKRQELPAGPSVGGGQDRPRATPRAERSPSSCTSSSIRSSQRPGASEEQCADRLFVPEGPGRGKTGMVGMMPTV